MRVRSLASTWVCGWSLFALLLIGLRYCGLLGLAWRWVLFCIVILPLAVLVAIVAACGALNGAMATWQWLEDRVRADRERREMRRMAKWLSADMRARRAQRRKEAIEHGE